MPFFYSNLFVSSLLGLTLYSGCAAAHCTRNTVLSTKEDRTVIMNFSQINITSAYLQPGGTLLGNIVVSALGFTNKGASASSVLWTCDEKDLPYIYFLVSNNGDDRLGGHWETGAEDNVFNVYATWWENIGIKLSMSGTVFNRNWQKIPISNYELVNGKVEIRLMDIPPLEASLYKISNLPPTSGHASNFCTGMGATGLYNCNQPSGYIQLSGDSRVSFGFAHDRDGDDSRNHYEFYGADNGIGYALRTTGPVTRTETCALRNVSPMVQFPPTSDLQLQQGEQIQANIAVEIECSDRAVSGTNENQTAIAFQASHGAYTAAQNLGLAHPNGTTKYLLSNEYQSDSNLAKGVGIRLKNSTNAKEMLFVNPWKSLASGEVAGWYPVLDGLATDISEKQAGYNRYVQNYTAILEALPGQQVSPGKINATATVVVKLQ